MRCTEEEKAEIERHPFTVNIREAYDPDGNRYKDLVVEMFDAIRNIEFEIMANTGVTEEAAHKLVNLTQQAMKLGRIEKRQNE